MTFVKIGEFPAAKKLKENPVDLRKPRNFSNFIEGYLEYTSDQEATEKMRRWVAISVIGAALERRIWLDTGFITYPNLYTFIVADSGKHRKSTAIKDGIRLVRALGTDGVFLASKKTTNRGLIDQLVDSKKEFELPDRTQKQSPIFCTPDELIVFLRDNSEIVKDLTNLYDNDDEWVYRTKEDGNIVVTWPCINILGGTTATWLTQAIPVSEQEGGFASRIIYVVENSLPEKFIAWPVRWKERKVNMLHLIEDLKQINTISGEFTFTSEARAFYENWYVKHRTDTSKLTDPRFGGYYSRKNIYIWKLAMILSVAESNKLIGEVHHVKLALKWLNELEDPMLEAFGNAGSNRLAHGMKVIFNLIKERKSLGYKDILRLLFREYNGSEISQIMEDLKKMGEIKQVNRNSESYYCYVPKKDENSEAS